MAKRKKISLSDMAAAFALCAFVPRTGTPLIPADVRAKGKKAILAHIEWDHIVPLALGGIDHFTNLQPLPKEYHKAKTKRDMANISRARRLMKKQEAEKAIAAVRERVERRGRGKRFSRPMLGSKSTPFKRKINGEVVRREPCLA